MSDVFISYSRSDQETARALTDKLTELGYDIWWDNRLNAGDYFWRILEEKLRCSKAVIAIWSKNSVESEFVRQEAQTASEGKKLINTHLADFRTSDIPLFVRGIQSADVSKIDLIVAALKAKDVLPANKVEPTQQVPELSTTPIATSNAQRLVRVTKEIEARRRITKHYLCFGRREDLEYNKRRLTNDDAWRAVDGARDVLALKAFRAYFPTDTTRCALASGQITRIHWLKFLGQTLLGALISTKFLITHAASWLFQIAVSLAMFAFFCTYMYIVALSVIAEWKNQSETSTRISDKTIDATKGSAPAKQAAEPTPMKIGDTWIEYPRVGRDANGRYANFVFYTMQSEFFWKVGSHNRLQRGSLEVSIAGVRQYVTEVMERSVPIDEKPRFIKNSTDFIAIGTASEEGTNSEDQSVLAANRATNVAKSIAGIKMFLGDIYVLNMGQIKEKGAVAGKTDKQRPVLIVSVLSKDPLVNLGNALIDAMKKQKDLPDPDNYREFQLSKFR